MIQEHDRVMLTVDIPEYGLKAGDVGTVVDITPNEQQYTLEFFNFAGDTIAVVPVKARMCASLVGKKSPTPACSILPLDVMLNTDGTVHQTR
jgi:hypothetical protein